jgi:multiple sugar transport system ATP-binding protein
MASIDFQDVSKLFPDGTRAVDRLTLDVREGEFLILVGPSGCGKSTALRMVAGLETVSDGEIRIDGRRVNDVEPSRRDVAMVFQNYALYPHMTVAENMSFPLRQQRRPKVEIRERTRQVAKLLGIDELLDRKPNALSGGQRQRVAIGRALVRRPKAFLMDEPLSNLDAKLRVQMRAELISLHKRLGITTIYVTHDQTEAMTLGDRVVVIRDGVVQQLDSPERLYQHPRNTFVAGFIGSPAMNFLEGRLDGRSFDLGGFRVDLPLSALDGATASPSSLLVGVRPEDFEIDSVDAAQTLRARVELTERLGPETLAYFKLEDVAVAAGAEGEPQTAEAQELQGAVVGRFDPSVNIGAGDRVGLRINHDRMRFFDRASGASLTAVAQASPASWASKAI